MTFLGLEARTDLPKVPYPTALDFFVFLSFAFIFATIIQFAVVHYFTKYGSGECYFSSDLSGTDSSSEEEEMARRRPVRNQAVNVFLPSKHIVNFVRKGSNHLKEEILRSLERSLCSLEEIQIITKDQLYLQVLVSYSLHVVEICY